MNPERKVAVVSEPARMRTLEWDWSSSTEMPWASLAARIRVRKSLRGVLLFIRLMILSRLYWKWAFLASAAPGGVMYCLMYLVIGTLLNTVIHGRNSILLKIESTQK